MIHRDNRKHYEGSSALNQIIHREGPVELTVGDIDTYAVKFMGNRACVRLIEHKQPTQPLKQMQARALTVIDDCLRHAAEQSFCGIAEGSGVYVMRGQLSPTEGGRREVNFDGRQVVETLLGTTVLQPTRREELWDWLCCGTPHRLRKERW